MTTLKRALPAAAKDLQDDLQHLIEAIDRRVPRLERLAETGIARDAAELRLRAVTLMAAIEAAVVRDETRGRTPPTA